MNEFSNLDGDHIYNGNHEAIYNLLHLAEVLWDFQQIAGEVRSGDSSFAFSESCSIELAGGTR